MEISIQKPRVDYTDEMYGSAVEKVIWEKSIFQDKERKVGRLIILGRGVFGYEETRLEFPHKGVIIYQNWNLLLGHKKYLGIIKLEGFDEESKIFKDLTSKLNMIKDTEDVEILQKTFFTKDKSLSPTAK